MHEVRTVCCQNPLAPIPEGRRRRPAVLGRGLQRPAKVLAGVTKADSQPVMTANLVIERADTFELLGQRRRGLDYPGFDATPDLARQPWLALRAATDHDRIGAGHFERGMACSNEVMSPLTTSGIRMASLTARTAPQSALPL